MNKSDSSANDVRMRGFRSRSTVDEAIAWVDRHGGTGSAQRVKLDQCTGRVLAEQVVSTINVPSFDRAAMDGYAVRAAETTGADVYNPLSFAIVGQSLPGRACELGIQSGEAVRIMTGAPLPVGADSVVPAEYAREAEGQVELCTSVASGKHVGRIGEDISAGTAVLPRGRILRPQDVGVLASVGRESVSVVRRPVVRVIVTGEELVVPGAPREAHQIYEANSYLLRGLIERDGAALESIQHVADDRDSVRDGLLEPGADVVLISGGSSVGAEDHAPSLLAELGELAIHGIAMRPSSPTGIGRLGEALVLLLPGNPVSCLCAYDFFAGRAIRQMGGRAADWPYRSSSEVIARKIVSAVGRVDYCRVQRTSDGIVPVAISGASILSSTTRADGFVIVPADSEGIAPGETTTVYSYDG